MRPDRSRGQKIFLKGVERAGPADAESGGAKLASIRFPGIGNNRWPTSRGPRSQRATVREEVRLLEAPVPSREGGEIEMNGKWRLIVRLLRACVDLRHRNTAGEREYIRGFERNGPPGGGGAHIGGSRRPF